MMIEDLEKIINRAREGNHTQFSLIRNYPSYRKTKTYIRACNTIIKVFHKIEKRLMDDYLESLDSGQPDIGLLTAYTRFRDYMAFYKGEIMIIKSMRAEYRAYLIGSGHFWSSVLSDFERADEEQVDYRVAEWRLTL